MDELLHDLSRRCICILTLGQSILVNTLRAKVEFQGETLLKQQREIKADLAAMAVSEGRVKR